LFGEKDIFFIWVLFNIFFDFEKWFDFFDSFHIFQIFFFYDFVQLTFFFELLRFFSWKFTRFSRIGFRNWSRSIASIVIRIVGNNFLFLIYSFQ
jgi:hypothetical protein